MSAAISMAIALFLINAPFVAANALQFAIAIWFAADAIRYVRAAVRGHAGRDRTLALCAAAGNGVVSLVLVLAHGWLAAVGVALAGALRIFGIAWNIAIAPVHSIGEADETVVSELGLDDAPEARAIAASVAVEEQARGPIDRGWTIAFIATLFAIHIGRMSTDFTILGLASPAVAVLGDMFIAVVISLLVLNPMYLMWRGPTRWIERRLWRRHLTDLRAERSGWLVRATEAWLRWRLRFAIRMRTARYSIPATIGRGLQSGLPLAAILAATVPVWGMSWYFDTENWAAGMWNSWAESRTDTWREAMVRAVVAQNGAAGTPGLFTVQPPDTAGDFAFVVIGDTGEGDASQQILRDQLLSVAALPDVRFVVISSDVVYPTGAMKDYEAKFWLPFKGVTRPVYAIPGNHDWYDALEGFAATFLQADAARASIQARVEADLKITSTTGARIDGLIHEAERLRRAYGVPTGFQRGPFFEIQTDRFALLAIDTGILKTVDPGQDAWLEAALARAAGKFTMAILGHPFYAGGHDATALNEPFARLKQRLRQPWRVDRDGRRHARSRVLRGPGATGRIGGPLLRQWRRRRLSELRHVARLADATADGQLGALPQPRRRDREDREPYAMVEAAGVVVDIPIRGLAVYRRVALGRVRLQRRAVLPELRARQGRAIRQSCPPDSVRRQRSADVGRLRRLTGADRVRCAQSIAGRMDRPMAR